MTTPTPPAQPTRTQFTGDGGLQISPHLVEGVRNALQRIADVDAEWGAAVATGDVKLAQQRQRDHAAQLSMLAGVLDGILSVAGEVPATAGRPGWGETTHEWHERLKREWPTEPAAGTTQ